MRVQVVSDVVCPWCRIGKKNLRLAAERYTAETGESVDVVFLPFLLDPIRPEEEGESFRDRFVNRKGVSEEQMQQMFQRVAEAGAAYGLTFDFSKVEVAVNTVPAHELMELAPADKREALMDALMTAYFEQGQNVGDVDVLLGIARSILGEAETNGLEQSLRNHTRRHDVMEMIQQVQQSGISGVPFTIVDSRFAISGGQPPQAFYDALIKAREANDAVATRAQ